MTQYILPHIERKKLANGSELINTKVYEEQVLEDVTIWKTDSKGVEFPNFDNLKEGDTIEANFWRNPTSGKASLYPVKAMNKNGTYKPKQTEIKKAMEEKRESISNFQDNKEMSIKIASTFSAATNLTIALIEKGQYEGTWQDKWLEVRDWLWSKYDTTDKDQTPF